MKLKYILIFFILTQSLFSESNFSISLRGGKAIALYSGISKWEYDDDINDPGLLLTYRSKPINVWIDIPTGNDSDKYTPSIGISHYFYVNPHILLSLSGEYWEDKTTGNVKWRGPNRKIGLGFTNRFEAGEKIDYFWGMSRAHHDYNFGHADGTSISSSVYISLNKGFSVSPWFAIWKWDNYDAERGLGVSFSYKFIYK